MEAGDELLWSGFQIIAAALISYDAGIGVESLATFFVLAIVNVGLVAALYSRH